MRQSERGEKSDVAEVGGGVPRYKEILDDFRQQIASGILEAGARLPTFTEMREQSGASQATMERVYSLLEREGLITRERGRGIFVAVTATPHRTGLIGYIGMEVSAQRYVPVSSDIIDGIEDAAYNADRRLLLLKADSTTGWDKVDGLLYAGRDFNSILGHIPPGMPFISLLTSIHGVTGVVSDDYGGARQAVFQLAHLGHCRIAAMMESSAISLRLRTAGYFDAMRDVGLEVQQNWLRDPDIDPVAHGYRTWGREGIRKWLNEDWRELGCTAILVQNDIAAVGVMEGLQEAGYNVPGDVSVIGYGGTDVCDYSTPRLTAIQVPLRQIGFTAAEVLIQKIDRRDSSVATIMLPTSLKPGDSTAAPAPEINLSF